GSRYPGARPRAQLESGSGPRRSGDPVRTRLPLRAPRVPRDPRSRPRRVRDRGRCHGARRRRPQLEPVPEPNDPGGGAGHRGRFYRLLVAGSGAHYRPLPHRRLGGGDRHYPDRPGNQGPGGDRQRVVVGARRRRVGRVRRPDRPPAGPRDPHGRLPDRHLRADLRDRDRPAGPQAEGPRGAADPSRGGLL
ncbi:MAG: hypothetical protein AVDCRST_MAG59-1776, partial [uncultured Thermomicrobiales bacterium]